MIPITVAKLAVIPIYVTEMLWGEPPVLTPETSQGLDTWHGVNVYQLTSESGST